MPKRKIKEEKPKKRLGKKGLLLPPIAMGAATLLALVVIPAFAPPPTPREVCLKAHNIESFQLQPRIEVIVDGKGMLLPDDVGREPKDGQDCLRPIHTDGVGNIVHIEYIRPVRLTLDDFIKIYAPENGTITTIDNSTGKLERQVYALGNYSVQYSYFSEGKFIPVAKASDMPPFPADNKMVARIELSSKS